MERLHATYQGGGIGGYLMLPVDLLATTNPTDIGLYAMLVYLWYDYPEGVPISAHALAAYAGLRPGTTRAALTRMRDAGWLELAAAGTRTARLTPMWGMRRNGHAARWTRGAACYGKPQRVRYHKVDARLIPWIFGQITIVSRKPPALDRIALRDGRPAALLTVRELGLLILAAVQGQTATGVPAIDTLRLLPAADLTQILPATWDAWQTQIMDTSPSASAADMDMPPAPPSRATHVPTPPPPTQPDPTCDLDPALVAAYRAANPRRAIRAAEWTELAALAASESCAPLLTILERARQRRSSGAGEAVYPAYLQASLERMRSQPQRPRRSHAAPRPALEAALQGLHAKRAILRAGWATVEIVERWRAHMAELRARGVPIADPEAWLAHQLLSKTPPPGRCDNPLAVQTETDFKAIFSRAFSHAMPYPPERDGETDDPPPPQDSHDLTTRLRAALGQIPHLARWASAVTVIEIDARDGVVLALAPPAYDALALERTLLKTVLTQLCGLPPDVLSVRLIYDVASTPPPPSRTVSTSPPLVRAWGGTLVTTR